MSRCQTLTLLTFSTLITLLAPPASSQDTPSTDEAVLEVNFHTLDIRELAAYLTAIKLDGRAWTVNEKVSADQTFSLRPNRPVSHAELSALLREALDYDGLGVVESGKDFKIAITDPTWYHPPEESGLEEAFLVDSDAQKVTVDFRQANIRDVTKFVTALSKKPWIVDNAVPQSASITMQISKPITQVEFDRSFREVLTSMGLDVVQRGDTLTVVLSKKRPFVAHGKECHGKSWVTLASDYTGIYDFKREVARLDGNRSFDPEAKGFTITYPVPASKRMLLKFQVDGSKGFKKFIVQVPPQCDRLTVKLSP